MDSDNSPLFSNSQKQILVFHNLNQTKNIIGNILAKEGYNVVYSTKESELLNLIFQDKIAFDLIIFDLLEDTFSAIEICKKIKNKQTHNQSELTVLFASNRINSQFVDLLYSAGGSDYIAVPFIKVELLKKIKNLLAVNQYEKLQNTLELKTQIFKANTHDLKNPLSSIFSLSGIPVGSFKDKEEIQQTLNIIHLSSKIMIELVNQIMEYLRNSEVQFRQDNVDVVTLVNQIVEINTPLAHNKKQTIHFTYSQEDCFIIADTNKIFQATNNIVSNAVKFSEFGKNIWINISKNENKIIVEIKDEGPGFKKDELSRVFTVNGKYSAKPTNNEISTGLGLLITKQIIMKSNGKICLESEEGKGSKFTMEYSAIEV